ncbi:TetR/AcrR family transcriptional regulator [Streptomyces sp. Je 1-4]|uniref:ScbR family autoregulator-binding transcription factor n=1 Tax=Streptomyces TaxID=1883 RepID=UPI00140ECC65|nr:MULTISPECIES: ScbR family autoregulator-binding transcription factor [unclassified Streptomyces]QIK05114.1 TetR/AcrR family transcriptional regulator [Streptomyces sp. ID38640]UYB38301.1 TetR/AcrR family transcriptional regulator [Streptomyces sp. Je 1-4]UZQ34251.1 TetR/AcrR family transcriptional regulator [Streptomyces sp. Je 1-4] [Streptomyces sp. Je 1-4 4N24]UZQ41669.1 TetR/AcrR family transcriptional regulator [Streptomyces sp. Je 1-4] [Streptomyces sp. Je 1-4 4N24_ara]
MAQQDRAIRTRRVILEAAASVFDEQGYDRATIAEVLERAGVTKGALYFHFASKEQLALAVLEEQVVDIAVEPQKIKLQEFVDSGQVLAFRLRSDPIQRGAARLAVEQGSNHLDRKQSMLSWTRFVEGLLNEARDRGEILESIVVRETAELFVGAFAGLQMMSQALTNQADLSRRLTVFFEHTLPSIAVPAILAKLNLDSERGAQLDAALQGRVLAKAVAGADAGVAAG